MAETPGTILKTKEIAYTEILGREIQPATTRPDQVRAVLVHLNGQERPTEILAN